MSINRVFVPQLLEYIIEERRHILVKSVWNSSWYKVHYMVNAICAWFSNCFCGRKKSNLIEILLIYIWKSAFFFSFFFKGLWGKTRQDHRLDKKLSVAIDCCCLLNNTKHLEIYADLLYFFYLIWHSSFYT